MSKVKTCVCFCLAVAVVTHLINEFRGISQMTKLPKETDCYHAFDIKRADGVPEAQPPRLVTVVMGFDRPDSMKRALDSLEISAYPTSNMQHILKIAIDRASIGSKHWNVTGDSWKRRREAIELAESYVWTHGPKLLHLRARHSGLATQWFEVWNPLPDEPVYFISIVEDDLEFSPLYYTFLSKVEEHLNVSKDPRISMLCLNSLRRPSNTIAWLLPTSSDHIGYTCSWGAIWKSTEWRKFIMWLQENLDVIVPYSGGADYDRWIDEKRDLQSVWQARYFKESGLQFLNFDLRRNTTDQAALVINHKEPGVNYNKKQWVDESVLLRSESMMPTEEEWKQASDALR